MNPKELFHHKFRYLHLVKSGVDDKCWRM